ADLSHRAPLLRGDQRGPGLDVLVLAGVGPVDQVQISRLPAEPEAALIDALSSLHRGVMAPGQFRGDDHRSSVDGGRSDAVADGAFVLIVEGCVDQAVPRLQRSGHSSCPGFTAQTVCPEAEDGYGESVVGGDLRDDGHRGAPSVEPAPKATVSPTAIR